MAAFVEKGATDATEGPNWRKSKMPAYLEMYKLLVIKTRALEE